MGVQNYILLALGLFMALIVTVVGVHQYLLDEHPASKVDGLIWRVENAFAQVKDLEAVLEFTEHRTETEPMRMLVRLVNDPLPVLSARYLAPDELKDEVYTVQNDLLSHYLPRENLIVIKRWVGLPVAAMSLSGLDLSQIKEGWEDGRLQIDIVQDAVGFPLDAFASAVEVSTTLSDLRSAEAFSFSIESLAVAAACPSFSSVESAMGEAFQTSYALEVRDARTRQLNRIIWIDRTTFFIQRVDFYSDGDRDRTIRVQRMTLNQGLTTEEILALPRGTDVVRG